MIKYEGEDLLCYLSKLNRPKIQNNGFRTLDNKQCRIVTNERREKQGMSLLISHLGA